MEGDRCGLAGDLGLVLHDPNRNLIGSRRGKTDLMGTSDLDEAELLAVVRASRARQARDARVGGERAICVERNAAQSLFISHCFYSLPARGEVLVVRRR